MKELDKNALLEEAIERGYGKGIKIKAYFPEYSSTYSDDREYIMNDSKPSYEEKEKAIRMGGSIIYHKGKWAEIVEEPKVETKFEKGKWYYYEHGENGKDKYYLKYDKHNSDKFYYIEYIKLMKNAKAIRQVSDVPFKFMYNIKEVPLSEIQQYLPADHPDKIKEFVLPEKWCVKVTSRNYTVINKWKHTTNWTDRAENWVYVRYDGAGGSSTEDNTEITFEQFKKYVLKDNVKEEVKSMEEWSVGSYAVALINAVNYCSTKKGDIYLIRKNHIADNLTNGNTDLTFILPRVPEEFKWFPTLQEAQKFSDKLLGKSKTGLGVEDLVEGEFYKHIKNNNILKWATPKQFYLGDDSTTFNYRNGNWDGEFSLATPAEKKWLKTCIKQDKFIPQDQLDKYDDEGNLMESKGYPEYYECISRDSENFTKGKIYKILNPEDLEAEYNFIDDLSGKNGWSGRNYKHFKPSTREAYDAQFKKDEEFKVGDKVICIKNEKFKIDGFNYSEDLEIGKLYTVTYETRQYGSSEELGIDVEGDGYTHPISNFRKVLPHEIPIENSVKQYPYTPEESLKLDFEVKWKEPRYIGGVDPISAFSWGIFEQMKKQSPQCRKTPDLIDKTKVKVEIKRTKVKQIKL